jgi:hypothetical protein
VLSCRCREDGLVVLARAHAGIGEEAVVGDPLESLVVDFLGVGLEHPTFAGSPAARFPACNNGCRDRAESRYRVARAEERGRTCAGPLDRGRS